jgi:cobalamin synthase
MDSRQIVLKETGRIAIGELVCVAVMLGVFALLNRLDSSVWLGAAAGTVLAVGNFFFMAVTTGMAVDRAKEDDAKTGKRLVQTSQTVRLLVLAVLLFALGKSGLCNVLSLLLPLAFVRPAMMVMEFFRKKDDA